MKDNDVVETGVESLPLRQFKASPSRLPVHSSRGILGWLRAKLFNSFWNSLLTVSVIVLLYLVLKPALNWAIFDAVWSASNRRECLAVSPDGACWAGVIDWFNNLIYGRYPNAQQWRVNLGFLIGVIWLASLAFKKTPYKAWVGITAMVLYPFLASCLFLGGSISTQIGVFHAVMGALALGFVVLLYVNLLMRLIGKQCCHTYFVAWFAKRSLRNASSLAFVASWLLVSAVMALLFYKVSLEPVPIDHWGGLFLTFIIAGFSISMAIPVGVVLALGRRSKLPVIHWLSLAVIELVRSVPLITVLFMAVTLLPIFLPADMQINKLSQVLVAVCLFAGAYMAENIRGGLQAIPAGQYEAAQILGLGYWKTMILIILPQALRMMIPNIMTSFISLLKDTTLVSIIGLFDIMLMARNIANDKNWFGLDTEPLVLISIIFFVLCYGMSQYSLNLEKRLKVDR